MHAELEKAKQELRLHPSKAWQDVVTIYEMLPRVRKELLHFDARIRDSLVAYRAMGRGRPGHLHGGIMLEREAKRYVIMLKEIYVELGLSRGEASVRALGGVADALGTSVDTLSYWICGKKAKQRRKPISDRVNARRVTRRRAKLGQINHP